MKFTVGKLIEDLQTMVQFSPEIKNYEIVTSIDNNRNTHE
jgi:hypothetical protein